MSDMVLPVRRFDLAATILSGQAFHWHDAEGRWHGCVGDRPVCIYQTVAGVRCRAADAEAVIRYFGLDDPIEEIHARLGGRDPAMRRAIAFAPGLRILRQPLWECLASFLTSPMKKVAHIRAISLELRRRYGVARGTLPDGTPHFSYPTAASLASAGEAALRRCGLGYRAKSLALAARAVADGRADLESWTSLPTDDLRTRLRSLHGVGDKIADCVLLFAYGRGEAFPIDVWVARAMRAAYFPGEDPSLPEIAAFARRKFGPWAGYAQQFLFHEARLTGSAGPARGA